MDQVAVDDILYQLRTSLESENWDAVADIMEHLHPADQAEIYDSLSENLQDLLLDHLDTDDLAGILGKIDEDMAAELVDEMSTEEAIRVIDLMDPDDAADLLGDIDADKAQQILAGLEDSDEIHPLLGHQDDTAGGLMTSEFLALRRQMSVDQAIQAIRAWEPDAETIFYLFVVDIHNQLMGVVSMRQLIVTPADTPLSDIVNPNVHSVLVGTDEEECARIMSHYDLLALPVVDENNVLLGIVTIDDVVDVLKDTATEDMQRFGGSQPLEGSYLNTRVFTVVRKRIGWLLLLFVTGSLASTVLRFFSSDMEALVELAIFVPLLIGTGGNAGSQTTSTIIGAIANGDIVLGDALRTLWHEARIGITMGVIVALFTFGRVVIQGSSPEFSATVAVSIFMIVVWANVMGSLLPLILNRLRLDPSAVSGPVMSTFVDATGLLIYFNVARYMLSL